MKIDLRELGDTELDNLLFLWYDEDNYNFVELETILDENNSTVTVETTHFSKYMVVDKQEWFDNWRKIYNIYEKFCNVNPSITAICVDCSGSMSTNDPFFSFNGLSKCHSDIRSYYVSFIGKFI